MENDRILFVTKTKIKELETLYTFSKIEKNILEKVIPYFVEYNENIQLYTSVDFDENRTVYVDIKKYHNLEDYEHITYDIELNDRKIYYYNKFYFKKYNNDKSEDELLTVDEFIEHFTDKFLS